MSFGGLAPSVWELRTMWRSLSSVQCVFRESQINVREMLRVERAHVLVVNDDVNYCVCSHCIHSNGHRRNFSPSPSVAPSPSSVNPFHLSVPMTILAYRFCTTTTTTTTRIICEWGVCCMCMNGVFELFIGTNPCWLLCSGIHIEEVLISGVPQVNWIWLGKTSNWWRVLQRFDSL